MRDFDYLALSGYDLRLFLTVIETGSVTEAAVRLGLTQSAVSHALQRLRRIAGDPLFVKSGRSIVPTPEALALAPQAQEVLDGLHVFGRKRSFDPATAVVEITIAGNDFQRDLLLPTVFERLRRQVASLSLRIIPSGTPTPDMLRESVCDFIIAPVPPEGADIVQKRLFEDRYACFYDAETRGPPADFEAYLAARHVTVIHSDTDRLQFDKWMEGHGYRRDFAVLVTNFSGVPIFLRGTDLLASLPSLTARHFMRDFASVPVPLPPPHQGAVQLPMYLAWHRRTHLDPVHSWVRETILAVAAEVTG